MTVKVNSTYEEPSGGTGGVDNAEPSCSETGDFLVTQALCTSDSCFSVQCAVWEV